MRSDTEKQNYILGKKDIVSKSEKFPQLRFVDEK